MNHPRKFPLAGPFSKQQIPTDSFARRRYFQYAPLKIPREPPALLRSVCFWRSYYCRSALATVDRRKKYHFASDGLKRHLRGDIPRGQGCSWKGGGVKGACGGKCEF
ncbi:hypothetical protein CDAR_47661 [Caerostris darwini]|uniref:Uncharacterized protein n=1 Tax=Caerostris darwini TaxID=1538125 RepID=A0AAV4M8B4_9ARAC|nr:hypothetical protein CDAR_47661 [Caerostris darwini]